MAEDGKKLYAAAADGDAETVLALLKAGAPVDARAEFGDTALNIAAENGQDAVVAVLLGAGADIENLGGADKTPLMNAAFAGHLAVVRRLVDLGALISDDLLDSVAMKVRILEENAEDGMVRPQAAEAWRDFLAWLISERRKQDSSG